MKAKLGMSQRAYAASRGIARPYINRLVHAGIIPTLPDGSIDPDAADRARAENIVPRMPRMDCNQQFDKEALQRRFASLG